MCARLIPGLIRLQCTGRLEQTMLHGTATRHQGRRRHLHLQQHTFPRVDMCHHTAVFHCHMYDMYVYMYIRCMHHTEVLYIQYSNRKYSAKSNHVLALLVLLLSSNLTHFRVGTGTLQQFAQDTQKINRNGPGNNTAPLHLACFHQLVDKKRALKTENPLPTCCARHACSYTAVQQQYTRTAA